LLQVAGRLQVTSQQPSASSSIIYHLSQHHHSSCNRNNLPATQRSSQQPATADSGSKRQAASCKLQARSVRRHYKPHKPRHYIVKDVSKVPT
jgi:hypothetical protein